MAAGAGSPCGACKFLRRKCAADCIFAPYFNSEQGPARFAAIHKIFGASNVSKLLQHVPATDRCEAVVTISYEAQARLRDPVYGCVARIFYLQQQVAILQAQLMQVKAHLANSTVNSRPSMENLVDAYSRQIYPYLVNGIAARTSSDTVGFSSGGGDEESMQEFCFKEDEHQMQNCSKRKASQYELGELQALALRMMRN